MAAASDDSTVMEARANEQTSEQVCSQKRTLSLSPSFKLSSFKLLLLLLPNAASAYDGRTRASYNRTQGRARARSPSRLRQGTNGETRVSPRSVCCPPLAFRVRGSFVLCLQNGYRFRYEAAWGGGNEAIAVSAGSHPISSKEADWSVNIGQMAGRAVGHDGIGGHARKIEAGNGKRQKACGRPALSMEYPIDFGSLVNPESTFCLQYTRGPNCTIPQYRININLP